MPQLPSRVRDIPTQRNFDALSRAIDEVEVGGGEEGPPGPPGPEGSAAAITSLLNNGIGMVIGTGPRLTDFAHTWYISPSTEEPTEIEEYDIWTKPE